MSLSRESGGSGIALGVACWHFFQTGDWNDHGVSQMEGEGAKIPSLNGTSIKEFGAMFSNSHKYPLDLRFCPQTMVTLKGGVLTQDP